MSRTDIRRHSPVFRLAMALALCWMVVHDLEAAGKSGKKARESVPVVAEMGEVQLTAAHFQWLLGNLDAEDRARLLENPKELRKLAIEELVKQLLIRQAKSEGWDRKPEVVTLMNRAADEALFARYMIAKVTPEASFPPDQTIREVYEKNRERLIKPDRIHLAQIYLTFPGGDSQADMEPRLAEVRRNLEHGDFGEVARQVSDHKESAGKGGDMGWQEMNNIGPELRPVLAALKPGEVSQPLKSDKGWHILKVLEREHGKTLDLEEARPGLVASLRAGMAKNKEGLLLEDLLNRHAPKIDEESLVRIVKKGR